MDPSGYIEGNNQVKRCLWLFFQEIVKGDLVLMQHFFAVPFINGMLHILARTTLPRSEYKTLFDLAREILLFQRGTNDFGGAITITPWLKDVLPGYSGYNDMRKGNQALLDFLGVSY